MSRSSRSDRDGAAAVIHRLADHERLFWFAAILTYGLGDTVTTLGGLHFADVAEVGPVAGPAIESFGGFGLIVIKLVLFAIGGAVAYLISRPTRVAIPVALTLVGGIVTVWNTIIILLSFA